MNLLLRLTAVATLFTASVCSAASAFEGKVSFAITSGKDKPISMDYSIKGNKLRTDTTVDKHHMSTIFDVEKLEMLMLMPEQKMYMVMPIKKAVEKATRKNEEPDVDIEATGKTDTILGYKCEQLLVKDKKTVTELWVAQGLGVFMGLGQNGPMGGGPFGGGKSAKAAKWEEVLRDKGGFPLRVISNDAKGRQSFKMEATKIEKGSVPDSVFQVPAGWEKFQMPDLGGLLKGLGGQ